MQTKIVGVSAALPDGKSLSAVSQADNELVAIHGAQQGDITLSKIEAMGVKDMLNLLYPTNNINIQMQDVE